MTDSAWHQRITTNNNTYIQDFLASPGFTQLAASDKAVTKASVQPILTSFAATMLANEEREPRRWTVEATSTAVTQLILSTTDDAALLPTMHLYAVGLGAFMTFMQEAHHLTNAKPLIKAVETRINDILAAHAQVAQASSIEDAVTAAGALYGFTEGDADESAAFIKAHLLDVLLMGTRLTVADMALLAQIAEGKQQDAAFGANWVMATLLPDLDLNAAKAALLRKQGATAPDAATRADMVADLLADPEPAGPGPRAAAIMHLAGLKAGKPGAAMTAFRQAHAPALAAVPDIDSFFPKAPKKPLSNAQIRKLKKKRHH